MKNKRFPVICLAAAVILLLTGCSEIEQLMPQPGDDWVPEQTALVVNRDGTITEILMERLDQDYYDGAELQQMVNASVQEYTSGHGAQSLTVDEMTIEERQITLQMTYAAGADYAAYNGMPFFSGSMLGAQMEGYLFCHTFRTVEEGVSTNRTVSGEEPLSHKEYQVLVTDPSHMVKVPGKIRYVSDNADVRDEYFAYPRQDAFEDAPQGLVLPSNAVYKDAAPAALVSQEDLEKNLVYVIYEF